MSLGFLREFATSAIPADVAVRDFSDSCSGKAAERSKSQTIGITTRSLLRRSTS